MAAAAAHDADVVIVGAGPAGSAAAFFLAQTGRDVILVDRRTFPREKPCGEGILPAGAGVLERMGVLPALVAAGAQAFGGIRYHAPGGRTAEGRFPKGARGFGVRRHVLDETLLRTAAASPRVRVEEGFPVRELLRDASGAIAGVVAEGGRELRAPLVVGADGARSRVRKLAGLDGRATVRWGVRQHYRPVTPPPPQEWVDVYVTGTAEAYVTPVASGEYGVAWLRGDAASPFSLGEAEGRFEGNSPASTTRGEHLIRDTLRGRRGIAASLADAPATSEPLAASGMGSVARSPIADGVVLLGDAAGAPDPITGMGVAFALRCAEGLPHALAGAFGRGDFSRAALAPYLPLRRREVAGGFAVTRAVLWLAGRRARAELAVGALRLAPPLFPALFRLAAG